MREIKFRGIAINPFDNWVFGSLLYKKDQTTEKQSYYIVDANGIKTSVLPETIGQYTGLKDIDGIEIYENDIISVYDTYNQVFSKDGSRVIYSNEYVGGWVISNGKQNLNLGTRERCLKIIGNIHEN